MACLISSVVFMTKGPCDTTGSPIGSAWPNSTWALVLAEKAIASPSSLNSTSVNAGTDWPSTLSAPPITYRKTLRLPASNDTE